MIKTTALNNAPEVPSSPSEGLPGRWAIHSALKAQKTLNGDYGLQLLPLCAGLDALYPNDSAQN